MTHKEHDHMESPVPGLDQLSRQRPPNHDLWPAIESQLKPRRKRWQMPLAMAASVLLTIGITAGLLMNVAPAPAPGLPGNTSAFATPAMDPRAALNMDRTDTALIKANLQITRIAERQLIDALKQSPESRSLQTLLQTTRQQQDTLQALL